MSLFNNNESIKNITIEADKLDANNTNIFVTIDVSPSLKNLAIYKQLAKGNLPKESKPYKASAETIQPGEPLGVFVAPLQLLPQGFQDYTRKLEGILRDIAVKTFKVMRWRYNINSPHSPFSTRIAEFSLDNGASWHNSATMMYVEIWANPIINLAEYDQKVLEDLIGGDQDEPLPQEIILEAHELYKDKNYRSSLIMAVTALELAVKRHVSILIPDAAWLITEAPAPPIFRILTEFLPNISLKEGQYKFPKLSKKLLDMIKELVHKRNLLVHKDSKLEITQEYLKDSIKLVKDMTRLLEYCEGNTWATQYMSMEITNELDFEGA